MKEEIKQQFREDEVAVIRFWDKQRGEWISNVFPKIGGRLRLAHEENQELGIETEIYKYDEKIAVVIATCKTSRGSFKGIGMASVDRDEKIAPAILELAETRAISRSLRFAGYGVEYCSAEEVSHLQSTNNNQQDLKKGNVKVDFQRVDGHTNVFKPKFESNENNHIARNNENGNGIRPRQLSSKQFAYIQSLGRKNYGYALSDLSAKTFEIYGVEVAGLTSSDASSFIDLLHSGEIRSAAN